MCALKKIVEDADTIEIELKDLLESIVKNSSCAKLKVNSEKIYSKYLKFKAQVEQQNRTLKKHKSDNSKLKKEKEVIVSNNYLLEFKQKNLLKLAQELEEANETVVQTNLEMQAQADLLEDQKEALEDQADYLHEANERITTMHSELQQQRDEILKKNLELVNLNNEKNNLIGIVAHDLKSPLNQIEGLISLVKMTANLEGEAAGFMDNMNTSVSRLSNMIAKILDVEAIESKQLNLKMEKVDLNTVLKSVVKNYNVTAANKKIELTTTLPKNGVYAQVDQSFVNQVYENLISNAIKFSPPGRTIFISLSEIEGAWQCEIRDQGPGISPEDQKKLFGKFQKLSARPTGDETSTGLGLSIVKKYVDAMEGKIWCESELNKGASFFVEFDKID